MIFGIQNFLSFLIFGESPTHRKMIFQKIFFSTDGAERNSQHFLAGLVPNERYYTAAHVTRADWHDIAAGGPLGARKVKKETFWSVS